MRAILNAERKRILNMKTFILFFTIIILYSASSSYYAVKNYDIRDKTGVVITWSENLTHGKEETKGKYLDDDYIVSIIDKKESDTYIDEMNVESLVAMNFDGKKITELSADEIKSFYTKRLSNIREMLEEDSRIKYTKEDIIKFMERAGGLSSPLSIGYSEGWKVLNDGMDKFMPFLMILVALILLPLFGGDSQTKMKELYRSTRYGKRKLDRARTIIAYPVGIILYMVGMALYFIIKMIPFGLEGGSQPIQSSATTFFSLYNITNIQQLIMNVFIGLLAMVFIISFILLITIIMEGIMTGAVVLIFFWILLLTFDQMNLYPVNHYFSNFMPLRMTDFSHYYTGNEIYRIFGSSINCLSWVVIVSIILSISIIILSIVFSDVKRNKGL